MAAHQIALVVSRLLPGWLSSLALACVFLAVWVSPEIVGWAAMPGLRTAVFIEVAMVYGVLLMLAGRDHPSDWSLVLYVAAFVAIVLFATVGGFTAVVLALLLIARVVAVSSDDERTQSAATGLLGSAVLMGLSWLAVGVLPLPALGWSERSAPQALWWQVPTVGGSQRVPFALPAWAFTYFLAKAVLGAGRQLVRAIERSALKTKLKARSRAA